VREEEVREGGIGTAAVVEEEAAGTNGVSDLKVCVRVTAIPVLAKNLPTDRGGKRQRREGGAPRFWLREGGGHNHDSDSGR